MPFVCDWQGRPPFTSGVTPTVLRGERADWGFVPMADAIALASAVPVPAEARLRTADRVFRWALASNTALTLYWLYTLLTGHASMFFRDYRVDTTAAVRIAWGILFFYVAWGAIWWGIKTLLLRRFVGFTRDECRESFSSRMERPYDVAAITARYSERRIRISDMIGRRGRFITLACAGFFYLYGQVITDRPASFANGFLQDYLFDAVVTSWVFISFYYRDGFVATLFYGPQSRVMDGVLARANNLLITTLWTVFKFVMVPIGVKLAQVFPPAEFAPVFAMIWGSYIACDAFSEIIGSFIGKQRIRVWGVGDVNRKSVAGTVAGFAAALALCLAVVSIHGLGLPWVGLAFAIALSNSVIELYSPRGTDDFTMATANALICLAFGLWFR